MKFSGETVGQEKERLFVNDHEVPRWLFRCIERLDYWTYRFSRWVEGH
jgi:hypothetical protein